MVTFRRKYWYQSNIVNAYYALLVKKKGDVYWNKKVVFCEKMWLDYKPENKLIVLLYFLIQHHKQDKATNYHLNGPR